MEATLDFFFFLSLVLYVLLKKYVDQWLYFIHQSLLGFRYGAILLQNVFKLVVSCGWMVFKRTKWC